VPTSHPPGGDARLDITSVINQYKRGLVGAKTLVANGLCNHYGRMVGSRKARMGGFDLSTLKEPYRIEGKKTMGAPRFKSG